MVAGLIALLYADDHQPQTPQEWEHWLASTRNTTTIVTQVTGTTDDAETRLIHAHCHQGDGHALHADTPRGLLEPDAVKAARPVCARHGQ
jgi:hypothetical protein